jgi:hypothetical protein
MNISEEYLPPIGVGTLSSRITVGVTRKAASLGNVYLFPTNTMKLTTDQRRILQTTLAFTQRIAAQERLKWWGPHEIEEYNADVRYGPLWAPSMWFPEVDTNADAVRLSRALKQLEANGLVHTFRRHGRKCTHVRLTTEGTELAKQLTQATKAAL